MRPLKLGFVTEMIVLELEPNKGFAGVFIKTFFISVVWGIEYTLTPAMTNFGKLTDADVDVLLTLFYRDLLAFLNPVKGIEGCVCRSAELK